MDSSLKDTLEQLKLTGKRALAFDNFVMRRAWGVYYAVWAVAITLFVFISNLISILVPAGLQWIAYPVVYVLIGVLATLSVSSSFSKAGAAIHLRRSLYGEKQEGRRNFYFYFLGWLVLISAMVLISIDFQSYVGFIVLTGFLSAIALYVYASLKKHFGRVPAEGRLAVGVFAFSTIGGITAAAITNNPIVYELFWIPTIASWLFAALYTMYKAPEDLVMAR